MRYALRPFARRAVAAVLVLAVAAVASSPARAATPKQVNDALDRAKAHLYALQKNGHWDDQTTPPAMAAGATATAARSQKEGQWTGQTALAVYALLSAGEKPTSDKLQPAIEFLKKSETRGVYALGIRMQVWLHLPQTAEVRAAAKRDFDILVKSVKTEGSAAGMYTYVYDGPRGAYSHSRSQYGVLGVWAGEQMGFEVSEAYWRMVEKGWIDHQASDGGWTYMLPSETKNPITPGMTAVGVATLFITQDYTRDSLACKGNQSNPAIDRGLAWMGANMDKVATDQRYERDFHYITLYAVERIGVAAGIKYFNGVDWYQKGADWLIKRQSASGGFAPGGLGGAVGDTAFPMLFLARGRAPVAFNKLDYATGASNTPGKNAPPPPAWNQRPRDIANLTRWLGKSFERNLNWQVVPAAAPLGDLLDAPILYVAGTQALNLDDAAKRKLKAYVEAGGMIVGNADCAGSAFNASFRKLAGELFPTYEFRELPPDHPLYHTALPRSKWKNKSPGIQGLSNGVRELMVLLPTADPARTWQSRVVGGREDSWAIGGAIFLYVSEGKDLGFRGANHLVARDPKLSDTRTLAVHRIEHPGNWNPEPGGWDRIAAVVHNEQGIDLKVASVKLGEGKLTGKGLAHITGTAKFTFTPDKRAELKKFVEGGGTLLVDAAGGSGQFADGMETELKEIFGGDGPQLLPPEHPLFADGDEPITIRYRPAAMKVITGALKVPRVKAILVEGRPAVIFSREDLSAGIVGNSVEGVIGYEQGTATDLVANVVTTVAGGPRKKPTTAPAAAPAVEPKATTPKPPAKKKTTAK